MSAIARSLAAASLTLAMLAAGASHAGVVTLSGLASADNNFEIFISTSDTVLGTEIASGQDWIYTHSFSTQLTTGQNYYLHVVAWNYNDAVDHNSIHAADTGNPDMFLGHFSLAGQGFMFANGQTTLDTNTTDWTAAVVPAGQTSYNTSNWAAPTGAPVSFGLNNDTDGNPWSSSYSMAFKAATGSAQFIWGANPANDTGESFFSTEIIDPPVRSPNNEPVGGIPEPMTWALMLTGFAAVGASIRQRRRQGALAV
jgi:hypothetical protein